MAVDVLAEQLAGLDALEAAGDRGEGRGRRMWAATWPKLAAVAVGLAFWQAVAWSGWRPSYVLPGPAEVFGELGRLLGDAVFWDAVGITLRRAVTGYAVALVVGVAVGLAVSRSKPLRTAAGSLITGLQTMPSIAWFPFAILLFKLSEEAILFVVVLGAAPSIANGLVGGIDQVPPLYRRAGRVLGARGLHLDRHVVVPAALPSFVAGLKQGWAFAWRSLMAGELLVLMGTPSLGSRLQYARELADAPLLLALMLVVLGIGIAVDTVFSAVDTRLRRRRGLLVE
jgi:NitT/TauT family transport system permease protein